MKIVIILFLVVFGCSADYIYDASQQVAPQIPIERRFYRWFGDVDYDGMLTLSDVLDISAYIYYGKELTLNQLYRADVNSDMKVDSLDLNLIIKNIHGNGK